MISFLWHNSIKVLKDWRRACLILAIAILWFDFVGNVSSNYAFNMTESVPGKLFKMRHDLIVSKHDVVIFRWDDPALPVGVNHMTKHVLCWSGDTLRRDGLAFYCNDKLITTAKTNTKTGDPLSIFGWTKGSVPKGFFFAGTNHPDGYDSRYYGLVPLKSATVLEKVL